MEKGEIDHNEQFLHFPQCFQKACFPGASKGVIVWEWVKVVVCSLFEFETVSKWCNGEWVNSTERGMNPAAMSIINPQKKKKKAMTGIKQVTSDSQVLHASDLATQVLLQSDE